MSPFDSLFNLASPAQPYLAAIDLTPAQIATLQSAPVTVLPAPGAGQALMLLSAAAQVVKGSIPFLDISSDLSYSTFPVSLLSNVLVIAETATINGEFSTASVPAGVGQDRADIDNAAIRTDASNDDASGAILANALNAGGAGYVPGDTFNVDVAAPTPASGVVDTVGGGGAVLTYHLTANGAGYLPTVGATTTATSGAGAGLTINITSITPADGTARIWLLYLILNLP